MARFAHAISPCVRVIRETPLRFRNGYIIVTSLGLSGCAGDLSALDPAGPAATSIAQLWWVMLAGATVLFLLVMALFFLVMDRKRRARSISMRSWIVGGGLILPLPVLAALTGYALYQGEHLIGARDGRDVMRIEVIARNWSWEFRYPDMPGAITTLDVLHIPAGRPIEISATSEDVIHSFWVPRLGGKIDAIPGHVTRLRIEADRPGSFGGVCAEYCGTGHAQMDFRVIAHEEAAFEQTVTGGAQ